ncbi:MULTISPECIES: sulfur carrier protein ThiS [Brachybacterium]|uniref:Thiamine biosynthesis protein ThiS n=1 Tax=Brachybacterium alimentarium TaxID=47845 RepID=A0A2A3YJE6_9MICO|nr:MULTISPECIES: sulfur carrier protein ThiS [Brachybacterium]PCC33565.1 thiamine biosynthesis protein ThiS [Brachybacterium alimentarium]PCC39430.1 thiamine biosynthesis protein ThiS [Brachybacterium alimentarium]RCS66385.1 sulfur carrier protein ThiS [Brachybacterium sp. JB7]RCS74598.1 sulfur carrier protein ThiS [Brachybacterium alimentarium]RCS75254.1 sulfur carrier protein ThiS [Brachybacterium alimentarium]
MTSIIPLTVNAEDQSVPSGWTVRDLVAARLGQSVGEDGRAADGSPLGVAVALDDAVIPRSRWSATALADGARCEIVTAVQGG